MGFVVAAYRPVVEVEHGHLAFLTLRGLVHDPIVPRLEAALNGLDSQGDPVLACVCPANFRVERVHILSHVSCGAGDGARTRCLQVGRLTPNP